jgi:hypothetical protein
VFTPKLRQQLNVDASFEEKATMFEKPLHRDDRTVAELVAEAFKNSTTSQT